MVRRDEKQGTVVPWLMAQQNPLPQLQAKFKAVENGFRGWLAKQSLPIEAAVVTTANAAYAGAFAALAGTLKNNVSSFILTHSQHSLNPQSIASLQHGGGFLFWCCVWFTLSCERPESASSAANGLLFALVQTHFFLLEQELLAPPVEGVNCSGTRSMLNSTGPQNFERGLSTDSTLPLLTERDAATTEKQGLCAPSRRKGDI